MLAPLPPLPPPLPLLLLLPFVSCSFFFMLFFDVEHASAANCYFR